jgi:O-acetyl-ADP-ribose deacetylase (regulator of RNase III)
MVSFVKGNLFDSPAQVLTNTVNTVGVMGKGIALEFKHRFPKMFEDYFRRCTNKKVNLGQPYLWEDDRSQVLNFPTKSHWKKSSQLKDIETGLKYLADHYQEMGIASIAMPPLGCGNGGLDWKNVRPLVEKYLGSIPDLEVFVYELELAKESLLPFEESIESAEDKKIPYAAQSVRNDYLE